jgi:long-chain-fatty-acid--CoA ligase ACSBG
MDSKVSQEHIVSYLPLAHVAAQALDIYINLIVGGTTWFAQPDALKGSLIQTVREVRPTIFLGVPRVWEKLAIGMQTYASSLSGTKKKLSQWAKGIGLRGNLSKQEGGKTPFGWTLARLLVFKQVSKRLGMDRCHHHLTGAAPISDDTLTYFLSLNICLHQLYGMSESTGPSTVTTENTLRFRSNGYAMKGTEIKIVNADETGVGEVVIKGRNVFMGYLNNFEKTAQVFTSEGYLRSGDFGRIDKDGYLYITGRMKELIVLANGDKVAPVPLEQMIKAEIPIISNAVIIGDKRTYLVCLLTLKVEVDEGTSLPTNKLTEEAVAQCREAGSSAVTVDDIIDEEGDKTVLRMIKRGIDKINKKATSKSQKIMRWTVLERDFSVAGQELTPTLKLKRPTIAEKYSEHIDFLY